ncbi:hypothetical protein THAOC_03144 [Thalassiosira oceanica]|uniref:Uncharacterized protein n=1 Tax=Thalassiosira oceanica TaxID=159749 RepID=K0T8V8_THAOC|nr:hypothetical protein THAOC_03144 [Thalassiosira oceanica]|eukprot:EJK75138.1 hypothetical protein THAOC_03144 [Thalassiosira oceanica]
MTRLATATGVKESCAHTDKDNDGEEGRPSSGGGEVRICNNQQSQQNADSTNADAVKRRVKQGKNATGQNTYWAKRQENLHTATAGRSRNADKLWREPHGESGRNAGELHGDKPVAAEMPVNFGKSRSRRMPLRGGECQTANAAHRREPVASNDAHRREPVVSNDTHRRKPVASRITLIGESRSDESRDDSLLVFAPPEGCSCDAIAGGGRESGESLHSLWGFGFGFAIATARNRQVAAETLPRARTAGDRATLFDKTPKRGATSTGYLHRHATACYGTKISA